MFTDEDFAFYFQQLMDTEEKMRKDYAELVEDLTDPELKEFFRRMADEEEDHAAELEEMRDCFRRS